MDSQINNFFDLPEDEEREIILQAAKKASEDQRRMMEEAKNNQPTTIEELKEQLAAIEHERWADWQQYMHSKTSDVVSPDGLIGALIPAESYRHWERQINTPYAGLSEAEKQSDRNQVERYFSLIDAYYRERFKQMIERAKQKSMRAIIDGFTEVYGEEDWGKMPLGMAMTDGANTYHYNLLRESGVEEEDGKKDGQR